MKTKKAIGNAIATIKKLLPLFAILFSLQSFSQNADAIVGKWINVPRQNTIIEVFKSSGEYKGKIAWSNDNKKKPVGYIILVNLKYNSKRNTWENGKVKDPNSGMTYDATAKIKSDGLLEVHGYMGFKFLGKKKSFRRVK